MLNIIFKILHYNKDSKKQHNEWIEVYDQSKWNDLFLKTIHKRPNENLQSEWEKNAFNLYGHLFHYISIALKDVFSVMNFTHISILLWLALNHLLLHFPADLNI